LSSLNKTLLLLTKIENNQFTENEKINLSVLINKVLLNYTDLINAKELQVNLDFKSDIVFEMNATLAEILISNLVQNAIRHNIKGGEIIIRTHENIFSIANNGEVLTINNDELFTRFKKNDASKDSLGLGLAIVESITEIYNFKVKYEFKNSMHLFVISFEHEK
jgi:signal transduction histidine kinase